MPLILRGFLRSSLLNFRQSLRRLGFMLVALGQTNHDYSSHGHGQHTGCSLAALCRDRAGHHTAAVQRRQQPQAQHKQQCQTWQQRPEIQTHFGQRPHQRPGQHGGIQPATQRVATPDQHAAGEQRHAGNQVVPGATQARELAAANGEHQAQ